MTLLLDLPLKTSLVPTTGSGSASITRATTKNVFDNEGKLISVKYGAVAKGGVRCEQNWVSSKSEDFTHASWIKGGSVTVPSANLLVCANATTAQYLQDASVINAVLVGQAWLFRYRVQYIDIQYVQIAASSSQFGAGQYCNFDLINGDYTATGCTASITSVSSGVWDIDIIATVTIAASVGINSLVLVPSQSATRLQAFVGDGIKSLGVIRCQFKNVTGQADQTASEYVSVGVESAPYYHGPGADGVKYFNTNKDGSKIESSAQKGALVDPASKTNTMLYCRDFTNAAWVKTNTTATLNQTGIDGLANACSLLEFTADGATILQTITAAAAAGCTGFDVKRHTGTGTIEITRDNVTWTNITSLINTDMFTTVAVENTSVTNPVVGFRGTSGDKIIVDAGRNHLGTKLCEPIFTTTAAVTRAAEPLTYQTSGNFSDTAGTILATFTPLYPGSWPSGAVVGKAGSGLLISSSNSGAQAADGTNTVNGATGAPANSSIRIGCRWSGSSLEAFSADPLLNVGTAGSYDGAFNLSTIAINPGAAGYIKDVKVYDASLTDAEIKTAWSLLDSQTFLPAFSNLPIYNAGAIIHVDPPPEPVDPEPTPIFATDFTGWTVGADGVENPQYFVGTWASTFQFTGSDSATGFSTPTGAPLYARSDAGLWGPGLGLYNVHTDGSGNYFHYPTNNKAGVATRFTHDIVDTVVRGVATKALQLKFPAPGEFSNFRQQCHFIMQRNVAQPDLTQLTLRVEVKLPNLGTILSHNTNGTGRLVFLDIKSEGDFRYSLQIVKYTATNYWWWFAIDNVANGGLSTVYFCEMLNTEPVPLQEYFTLEFSFKRARYYSDVAGDYAGKARVRIRRESDSVTTWRTLFDASESGIAAYNANNGPNNYSAVTPRTNRHMGIMNGVNAAGKKINRIMVLNYPRKLNVECMVEFAKYRLFDTYDV